MKIIKLGLISILVNFAFVEASLADFNPIDRFNCSYGGKRLYGKVQIVENFPDVKVKVVAADADLMVKQVQIFPSRCGEWQIVDAFADLRVKFVESSPDFTVQFVYNSSGIGQ
ncbi:MAG: hypothetical protein WA865_08520 [Spirulinaceae cyanobacterium]